MKEYLQNIQKQKLSGALNEKVILETEILAEYRKRIYDEEVDPWKKNALYRVFAQETKKVADPESLR